MKVKTQKLSNLEECGNRLGSEKNKRKMSGGIAKNNRPASYYMDRALIPRVQRYLKENSHRTYIDIEEMADLLQRQYPDYGRKKKLAFRNSVKQAYEDIRATLDIKEDSSDSDPYETARIPDTPETRETANESLRSMYSTNRTEDNSKLDDIMVIDVLGDHEKAPPQSTPMKKKIVKRKKVESDIPNGTTKKSKTVEFKSVISITKFSEVGGNEKSLKEVRKLILHMKHPEVYQHLGMSPPRGFLLHGPPGCGKTLLAHAIAGELEIPFFKVAAPELVSGVSGESEEQIRMLFDQATSAAPCIVFIDEIDAITPKRETAQREMERRIVAQLLTCMDGSQVVHILHIFLITYSFHYTDLSSRNNNIPVLVIGATNRPDSLDPALRRAGRFDREISLGIPDLAAREKILKVVCKNLSLSADVDWKFLALNTPGYVGADMLALASEAGMVAVNRAFGRMESLYLASIQPSETPEQETITTEEKSWVWLCQQPEFGTEQLQDISITLDDFNAALKCVQPSAQREGFATVPDVTWDNVGALSHVRQELHLAILAPIRYEQHYEALGLSSPSGVLLCGPPGCGKTLLAKAIANEAGINFISVKGPELLNMYVGESERAVRQCFQRARSSVPCVIFFDELDALCPRRSEQGHEGGASRVVNQLLTEMDGIESRRGVFLMAATNRPDIIDPAVLRPGRLDKILHVGFPTAEDRVDILRALTKNGTKPTLAADANLIDIGLDPKLDGYTGADLSSLVKESATQALQEFVFGHNAARSPDMEMGDVCVHLRHFQAAITKIRPSVNEKDRKHYMGMSQRL
ncbi:nuclear valosin-containing protein-like isoform X1 [Daphnia carinata]|uniref:nuclear valosin-containing protein-like isoform X1 n=1 Tax=Daphnia carinata TaxID=120202 RepID=UPI00257C602D|nr:nuclear valosin-containing protein-like isoform X1 [Daphnia carinata]